MSDLLLILLALLHASVLGVSLALTEDPPRWFVAAWNAVAHPCRKSKGNPRG